MSRILVVDDDKVAVHGLCKLLEMDGYEPVGLVSPEEALKRLEAEAFDALVTDLEMPKVHGLELIRFAQRRWAQMPVMVVTAYVGSPASQEALSAGARKIFGKPLRYELLVSELDRCVPAG